MTQPAQDFKEQMVEARRNQILMGAAQVFAEKGFHRATTKAIAKAAGISEGTIYNYFDNKRELLLAMIELIGTQTIKPIFEQHTLTNPREFFRSILRDRYQLIQEHGSFMAPLIAEMFIDASLREAVYHKLAQPLIAHLEQYLQAYIQAGHVKGVNPMIVARAIIGGLMTNVVFKATHLDPRYDDISIDELADQLVMVYFDGLIMEDTETTPKSDT